MNQQKIEAILYHVKVLCNFDERAYDYFLKWLAQIVQNPATSPSKYPPGFHTVDTLRNSWKPVYIPRGNYGNCCIGNPWKPMETIAF